MPRRSTSSLAALGLAALLTLAVALPASAAEGEWSTPVTLTEVGQDAYDPQVVTDGTTITAAWYGNVGGNDRVQVSSSVDGGLTWGSPVILSEAGQDAYRPQLVTDGTTVTVVWTRSDGSDARVQVSSLVDGGTWSTPVTLSEVGETATDAQVVTDGTTITAIWRRNDGSNDRIQVATSVGGGPWGAPVTVSGAGLSSYSPQVVTDGVTLTALWRQYDGDNFQVMSSWSVNSGVSWSEPVNVSGLIGSVYAPQVITDGTTVTAVWRHNIEGQFLIVMSFSVNDGASWSEPRTLSMLGGNANNPHLATDGTTRTVTYTRFDGSNDRVLMTSSVDGGPWGTPVAVSEEGGDAYNPQVVTDGTTLTAIWSRSVGSDQWFEVASSVDGGIVWSDPIAIAEAVGEEPEPQLVTDGTTITAVWYTYDGTNNRVQSSSIVNPADEPTVPEPAEPELAATGAHESLAMSLLAGGLLLAGAVLVAAKARTRRTA